MSDGIAKAQMTAEQVIERAYDLARHVMQRPPHGIARPFWILEPERMRWLVGPDIRDALIAGSTGLVAVAVIPEERLLGIRVVVDYKAPPEYMELVETVD